MPNKHRLKQLANLVLLSIVLGTIALYMKDFDYSQLDGITLKPGYFILAIIVSAAFRYWGVFIWRVILKELGATDLPSFWNLSSVYSKAWLGRYLPGKVTWIAGKVYFATQHGLSKKKLAVSSVLEAMIQVIAIFSVSLVFLAFDDRFDIVNQRIKLTMIVGGILLSLTLIPSVFNFMMRHMLRIIKRSEAADDMKISGSVVIKAYLLYGVGYFISGLSYYFFTAAIQPIEAGDLLYVMAVFNIAGAIGIASIVTPSGLGVREGVQLLLLPAIMPKEAALVVTAASRLFSIAIDVLFFLLGYIKKRPARKTAHD